MKNVTIVHGKSTDIPSTDVNRNAVKQLLTGYRLLSAEIDNEMERLDSLENKMYSASSPGMNGMPRNPSPTFDKMSEMVHRKEQLVSKIDKLIQEKDEQKDMIEGLSETLRNPNERAVILMRYIDLEDWDDVLFMLYGSRANYNEKYDNYRQRMFRLHNAAISKLAVMLYQSFDSDQ